MRTIISGLNIHRKKIWCEPYTADWPLVCLEVGGAHYRLRYLWLGPAVPGHLEDVALEFKNQEHQNTVLLTITAVNDSCQ